MADILNENGLSVDDYSTLLGNIQSDMNAIYAQDGELINFDSETPDGQMTNIYAQIGSDSRELAQNVYNSFDPDKCSGVVQDSRYALNYLTRKGGTFTIQNIDVTVNQTVTLEGLDGNYNDVNAASYTVSDDAGNLWYLIDTTTLTTGTTSLPFRSQNYGLLQPVINTITNQVTKVLGVTSVTNSVAPTTLGESQETDAEFRIRRNQSTAVRGQNNNDAMLGQILELDGVRDVKTFINIPDSADYDSNLPDYAVWTIVEGGANSEIADVIYTNSTGLPTYGTVTVDVPAISGQIFSVNFDRVNPVPLYIQFDLKVANAGTNIDQDAIKEYIANNLIFSLGAPAETSQVTEVAAQGFIANYGVGVYALNVEISTDGTTWEDYIASASIQDKFVVDSTRITINTPGE